MRHDLFDCLSEIFWQQVIGAMKPLNQLKRGGERRKGTDETSLNDIAKSCSAQRRGKKSKQAEVNRGFAY